MVGEDLEGWMDGTASLKDGSGCMDPRGGRDSGGGDETLEVIAYGHALLQLQLIQGAPSYGCVKC
jgi:hypothetical protein